MAGSIVERGADVRTANVIAPMSSVCESSLNHVGGIGARARLNCVSPHTPTISTVSLPLLNRRPIGLTSGRNLRTNCWLTMATFAEPRPSCSSYDRPTTIGMPMVSKNR